MPIFQKTELLKMKRKLIFTTLLFVSLIANSVYAQVTIETKIDTSFMLIGDQTNVRVEASYPAGYNVSMPVFADTIIDKLEIIEAQQIDTTVSNNITSICQKYVVTSFDTGWYAIPQFPYVVENPNGTIDTLYSAPVYFGVQAMVLDTANANAITDIKPMQQTPFIFKELKQYVKYVVWGIIIILVVATIVYIIIKRKRNEPIFAKPEVIEPAHIIAFRQLEQLKEQKLWQHGLTKEFYTALTDIIRTYLNNRFGVQAMESTTMETMQMIKNVQEIDADLRKNLQELLERADFVKFAKAQTEATENEASLVFVEHFVNETKLVEEILDTEENSSEKADVQKD